MVHSVTAGCNADVDGDRQIDDSGGREDKDIESVFSSIFTTFANSLASLNRSSSSSSDATAPTTAAIAGTYVQFGIIAHDEELADKLQFASAVIFMHDAFAAATVAGAAVQVPTPV